MAGSRRVGHGTLDLLAALEVHYGHVHAACYEWHQQWEMADVQPNLATLLNTNCLDALTRVSLTKVSRPLDQGVRTLQVPLDDRLGRDGLLVRRHRYNDRERVPQIRNAVGVLNVAFIPPLRDWCLGLAQPRRRGQRQRLG